MTLTLISDTHGYHRQLPELSGEVLIHAGDFCGSRERSIPTDFFDWLEAQDFKHKILVAGNHDFIADEQPDFFLACVPPDVIYLDDDGCSIEGINFWGSPVTPNLANWAFGKRPGESLLSHWNLIPKSTDVLITHTPAEDILDQSSTGYSLGCPELKQVIEQIQPKIHVFGHVHNCYGQTTLGNTRFFNASNMNSAKGLVNSVIRVEL